MEIIAQGATDHLVSLVVDTEFRDLPQSAVKYASRLILDTLGCAVGGFATDAGKLLMEVKQDLGGTAEATLLVTGARTSCTSAAYVNTGMTVMLDADDTYAWRGHHGNCTVLPALSMAERVGASGQDYVLAVALGFEVAARVGKSINMTTEYTPELGIRIKKNAGTSWMIFGAVAAAAKLMRLDKAQTARAFGIAASSATLPIGGQWSAFTNNRPMTKWAFPGPMAEAGLIAAILASKGYIADPAVLDHDRGFWRMVGASEYDPAQLHVDKGAAWAVEETSLKPYPSCRFTNGPLDALYRIIKEHSPRWQDIEEIRVKVCGRAQDFAAYELGNQVDAAFNLPHVFAMAVLGVEPGPHWALRLDDPDAKVIGRKVKILPYPEADLAMASQDKRISRVPHVVEVVTNGATFSASGDFARGDPWPEELRLTDAELERKFAQYSSGLLPRSNIARAIELSRGFHKLERIAELVSCLH